MALDEGLVAWVSEAIESIGTLSFRHMMGGATLYCDGVIFAIIAADALWFKADKISDAIWDAAGCERFTFEMKGKTGSMNYRRAPDNVHDDADTLRHWASLALEAGRRVPPKKKRQPAARES
jgi:DNA transformation protein and related proteins